MIARNARFIGGLVERGLKDVDTKADAVRRKMRTLPRPQRAGIIIEPYMVNENGDLRPQFSTNPKSAQSGLSPTKPPLSGCSNPIPPCFDLCCYPRAWAGIIDFALSWFGRVWNAFIQAGTSNFEYFTEGGIEQDFTMALRLYVQPYVCGCDLLNLILPGKSFPPHTLSYFFSLTIFFLKK